jgi:hypothetical protein
MDIIGLLKKAAPYVAYDKDNYLMSSEEEAAIKEELKTAGFPMWMLIGCKLVWNDKKTGNGLKNMQQL